MSLRLSLYWMRASRPASFPAAFRRGCDRGDHRGPGRGVALDGGFGPSTFHHDRRRAELGISEGPRQSRVLRLRDRCVWRQDRLGESCRRGSGCGSRTARGAGHDRGEARRGGGVFDTERAGCIVAEVGGARCGDGGGVSDSYQDSHPLLDRGQPRGLLL